MSQKKPKKRQTQTTMFPIGEDSPIISGTAQRATLIAFDPSAPAARQLAFDQLKPAFGETPQACLERSRKVNAKQGLDDLRGSDLPLFSHIPKETSE